MTSLIASRRSLPLLSGREFISICFSSFSSYPKSSSNISGFRQCNREEARGCRHFTSSTEESGLCLKRGMTIRDMQGFQTVVLKDREISHHGCLLHQHRELFRRSLLGRQGTIQSSERNLQRKKERDIFSNDMMNGNSLPSFFSSSRERSLQTNLSVYRSVISPSLLSQSRGIACNGGYLGNLRRRFLTERSRRRRRSFISSSPSSYLSLFSSSSLSSLPISINRGLSLDHDDVSDDVERRRRFQRRFFWSKCSQIFSTKGKEREEEKKTEGEEKKKDSEEEKKKKEEGEKNKPRGFNMTFVTSDGESRMACPYRPGQTVLMVAFENGVDIEGACGGKCACSTCHVILNPKDYAKFPEPGDDEQDMLDLAVHTTETSRLGCQMTLTEEHNGLEVRLPEETVNQMYR
ncbi:2fe-2s iron-sulfur cluster binding domain containing protein [Cystoisospora suis]|uniref:2fe-2s iron-sulfur cluster binding domain containing protein n=1 Tax=Cystoisospora suis TaxID=483139 RepID=A0A2C6L1R1_9APIC|nr:2fe-2s iron-sulfur cluster binding domain containing protein [Cystoisospora suis]